MFKGAMTVGEEVLRSSGDKDSDGVIVHIDRSGNTVWSRHLSGPGTDYCLGVAVDGAGNSFISGDFHVETTLAGVKLTSRGAGDAFLAGFDLEGKLLWMEQAGGVATDTAYPIAFRAPNELIVGGSTAAPAQFGDWEIKATSGVDFFGAKWLLKGAR
jgi:hypothetical protein